MDGLLVHSPSTGVEGFRFGTVDEIVHDMTQREQPSHDVLPLVRR